MVKCGINLKDVVMVTRIMKSKTPKVYKNKKLNNANFGNYNLNDYQVFLHLISRLGKVDELGKYQQFELLEREHTITAKEFSEAFNLDIDNAYPILKKAGTKLMQSFITLEQPELFETWQIAICERAKYNHKHGSLTILFTQSIMPYLAQVKQKFVLYNLKEIANFGSLYTTRLYELLQEFKDTGSVIKSIEQIRKTFAVGEMYLKYNHFKTKTFAHAVDEINSQYEINLEFQEIKQGNKVVAIHFTFKPTFIQRGVDPKTGKEKNIYIKPKPKVQPKLTEKIENNSPKNT